MNDTEQQAPSRIFTDTSEDCAICLEPLDTSSSDGDSNVSVLTLSCGHRWHRECLVQQLQQAQPSSTSRLLFNGCQCGKCGTICDHPELEHLTRTTDALREKVDRLLEQQLTIDAPAMWHEAAAEESSRKSLLDDARRKYAFFLCKHCREPYFGGTVDCADAIHPDDESSTNNNNSTEEERLCPTCSPQSQMVCQNPLDHQHCLVWKCRYCCQPATHVCYGNVHFCDDCHERNGQAVKERQRHGPRGATRRPKLRPIPCPGESCSFPKPPNQTHHINGSTKESEQVYFCRWCESSSSSRHSSSAAHQSSSNIPLGSHNLLQNPSGAQGLAHWTPHRVGGQSTRTWKVETSDWPVNASTATNFVSSFYPCVMTQQVDLHQVLNAQDRDQRLDHNPSSIQTVHLEFSAHYKARTDCPSFFQMQALLLDDTQRSVVQRQSTPRLEAPADCWERIALTMDIDIVQVARGQPRYAMLVVIGQDGRFWQGDYGSKVAECSIRILADSKEQLRQIVHSSVMWCEDAISVIPDGNEEDNTRSYATGDPTRHGIRSQHQTSSDRQENAIPNVSLWWEGIFPVVLLVLLAFLLAN